MEETFRWLLGVMVSGSVAGFAYLKKEIKNLRQEVKECHEEREKEKLWRTIYEDRLKRLEQKTGVKCPSDEDFPAIESE